MQDVIDLQAGAYDMRGVVNATLLGSHHRNGGWPPPVHIVRRSRLCCGPPCAARRMCLPKHRMLDDSCLSLSLWMPMYMRLSLRLVQRPSWLMMKGRVRMRLLLLH